MSSGPDKVEKMITSLRKWQGIERQAMEQTAEIIEKTKNPYLRIMMEVIRHDSLMHHRVQGLIIDSLTNKAISLSPEEIGEVWSMIEAHDETEREVVAIAKELRDEAFNPVHRQLLDYLLTDEQKHDRLLEQLGEVKKELAGATQ